MPPQLPSDATTLTPAWLTTALSALHPGVRVASATVIDTTERTNHHLRLALTYASPSGAPATLFCKLPPRDPAHRARIGAGGMGAREVHFYREVASSLSMRVPACSFAEVGDEGAFVLLLEDLVARGAAISDGSWAVPGRLVHAALAELAELHVRYEEPARLASVATWSAAPRAKTPDFVIQTLRWVVEQCAEPLSGAYRAIASLFIEHHEAIEAAWDAGPRTLIHGDAHIGNLFLDGERVGFLDWGMAKLGTPLRDVSFFLTMGVESADRREGEREWIQHYLDVRRGLGGSAIAFEDAWLAHRVHAAYTVIASFLSLVPPYNTEERRLFTSNFRARAMAAIEELDSVAALRAVGIG